MSTFSVVMIFMQCLPSAISGEVGSRKDCGYECLYVALKAIGKLDCSYSQFKRAHPAPGPKGLSIAQVNDVAARYAFSKPVEFNGLSNLAPWLGDDATAIVHLNRDHFVTVVSLDKQTVQYFDGGARYSQSVIEFGPLTSGNAIIVSSQEIRVKRNLPVPGLVLLISTTVLLASCMLYFFRKRESALFSIVICILCAQGCDTERAKDQSTSSAAVDRGYGDVGRFDVACERYAVENVDGSFRVDLGKVAANSAETVVLLELHNNSERDAKLLGSRRSCGCTSVTLVDRDIPAGETVSFSIGVSSGAAGSKEAQIELLFADSEVPILVLIAWESEASVEFQGDTIEVAEEQSLIRIPLNVKETALTDDLRAVPFPEFFGKAGLDADAKSVLFEPDYAAIDSDSAEVRLYNNADVLLDIVTVIFNVQNTRGIELVDKLAMLRDTKSGEWSPFTLRWKVIETDVEELSVRFEGDGSIALASVSEASAELLYQPPEVSGGGTHTGKVFFVDKAGMTIVSLPLISVSTVDDATD